MGLLRPVKVIEIRDLVHEKIIFHDDLVMDGQTIMASASGILTIEVLPHPHRLGLENEIDLEILFPVNIAPETNANILQLDIGKEPIEDFTNPFFDLEHDTLPLLYMRDNSP